MQREGLQANERFGDLIQLAIMHTWIYMGEQFEKHAIRYPRSD